MAKLTMMLTTSALNHSTKLYESRLFVILMTDATLLYHCHNYSPQILNGDCSLREALWRSLARTKLGHLFSRAVSREIGGRESAADNNFFGCVVGLRIVGTVLVYSFVLLTGTILRTHLSNPDLYFSTPG